MNDFEDYLRNAPLAEPGPAMDATIERFFEKASARPPRLWARPVALWKCAAACALCCAAGFIASSLVREPAPVTVHVTERIYYVPNQEPEYRNVFDTSPASETLRWGAPGPRRIQF